MPEFTHDWFTPHMEVLETHLKELRGKPVHALEIGCYEGRATLWFLDNIMTHQDSSIICIDTFAGSDEHREMGVDFSGTRGRFERNTEGRPVTLCVGRSEMWLRRFVDPFHLIYVDGSHLAADVLVDACMSWPLLVRGGIMVFDDYGWDRYSEPWKNPRLAIDSFLACMEGGLDLLHRGYRVIVRKK